MPESLLDSARILIVGTSGAGKSTLARQLSRALDSIDIELDALYWEENWTGATPDTFRKRIENACANSERWIIHGNYNKVRDLTWGKATAIIWLDYSRSVIFWRVLKRSISRIFSREVLWAGNRESFKKTFLSRESIILWSVQTYSLRKTQYEELFNSPEVSRLKIFRFKHPAETERFLAEIKKLKEVMR